MNKINKLFSEITEELRSIKNYCSEIDTKDLIDFYKEYQFHSNLVVDAINAQIIQYLGTDTSIPFSNKETSYMINAFVTFNKYNYDRLIVESLCVLNCKEGYQYLNKILNTDEKKLKFKGDFLNYPQLELVKKRLSELGNNI